MKVLFLGGTGNISTACVEEALQRGHDVTILNRGRSLSAFGSRVRTIVGDRDDAAGLGRAAESLRPDAVVDFLAYRLEQVEGALEAFSGRVGQYVFISSASAYERPVAHYVVTEETPLANPFWEYSRQKIACEERLLRAYRERAFPLTIVRPSYTYGPTWIPSAFGGQDYTVVDRMRRGRPIVCHGDGMALWSMTAAQRLRGGPRRPSRAPQGGGRGLPHHERRGPDLGRDLPDDGDGRGVRGRDRPRSVRPHRRPLSRPGRKPSGRQGLERRLRQLQDQAIRSRASGRGSASPRAWRGRSRGTTPMRHAGS